MTSTLSVFTSIGFVSALYRHWALLIMLASLLNVANNSGPFMVLAEPTLRFYPLLVDDLSSHNVSDPIDPNSPFVISPLFNYTPSTNPLISIPLPNIPHVKNSAAVLYVRSVSDSTNMSFVFEVSKPTETQKATFLEALLFGFLGVTLTNLCSLTGFICIPIQKSKYYGLMLTFMMALAVSALCSTAIIVLIPEAMRMVDMPLEFGGQGRFYLLKMGSVLMGTVFFYILEYFFLILPRLLKWNTFITESNSVEAGDFRGHSHALSINLEPEDIPSDSQLDSSLEDTLNTYCKSKKRRCGFRCTRRNVATIEPISWMILLGDGFHNMMDGLTIGAGFSESPTVGITLSLSILFEELPHELGDFAILISSGFSVKAAVCANFLSACSAYIGLGIGLAIGEVPSGALYVFSITAGLFLYISLSDMLPELRYSIKNAERNNESSLRILFIHLGGFIVGFLCVLGVTISSDYMSF